MRSWKRLWRTVLGVVLILYGVFALVTPFTPGSWLIFVGLGLLGIELALDEDRWLCRTAKRFGVKLKEPGKEAPRS